MWEPISRNQVFLSKLCHISARQPWKRLVNIQDNRLLKRFCNRFICVNAFSWNLLINPKILICKAVHETSLATRNTTIIFSKATRGFKETTRANKSLSSPLMRGPRGGHMEQNLPHTLSALLLCSSSCFFFDSWRNSLKSCSRSFIFSIALKRGSRACFMANSLKPILDNRGACLLSKSSGFTSRNSNFRRPYFKPLAPRRVCYKRNA